MRVTESLMYHRAVHDIASARSRVHQSMEQVSSGRRVHHVGDDPGATALALHQSQNMKRLDSMITTVSRAADEISSAESVLGRVGGLVVRAREIAMQFSNDSYPPEAREQGAVEIRSIFRETIAMMNSEIGGRYIFSGYSDDAPPFDSDGNYVGDTGIRRVEIAPGVFEPSSIPADVYIKGVGGGVDVLETLKELGDALEANDVGEVRQSLGGLDESLQQVSLGRALAGSNMRVFDVAAEVSRGARIEAQMQHSKLVDSDIYESASDLMLAQNALQAAVSATQRIFQISMLGRLG